MKTKKTASKVAHNRPQTFFSQYCLAAQTSPELIFHIINTSQDSSVSLSAYWPAQNQPKFQILFHKNSSTRSLYTMTFVCNSFVITVIYSCNFFDETCFARACPTFHDGRLVTFLNRDRFGYIASFIMPLLLLLHSGNFYMFSIHY